MIPCIDKESLMLLVGTADERFQHSPEYFRKTHFPQVMHRYYKNQLTAEVTEQELLSELKDVDTSSNRVYFIFGSTGAGKSELLCWIKDHWEIDKIKRPVIRISRSELNPQVLIKKCYETTGQSLNIQIDENRWDLLLKKPITLINQMVWSTLAECLHSDEEIVPAALLIRPIIEKNITAFTKQIQKGKIKKSLEIITFEQFQELMASTTVSIPIEYSLLQQSLVHKLDQFLFEGWEIGSLFKNLSKILKEQQIRPLLLIDDLVQSVNIYATEVLDQIVTLEEGNWDVVIGLTPGSLQDNARGSELIDRIQNLDTIDDRVKKLWLSDETGKAFYNLNRSQVIPYMSTYLKELKASRGYQCSESCKHYKECRELIPNTNEIDNEQKEITLLPLNEPFVKRIYDGIPVGKSKLRYMILNAKEIIRFFHKGNKQQMNRIHPLISREIFAEHSDTFIKSLAEWYSREGAIETIISNQFLSHFGYSSDETTVKVLPLETRTSFEDISMTQQEETRNDEHPLSIRDWIEGKVVNTQLLEPVRLGVSCLVNDVVKATNMSRKFTPRAGAIIQRKEVENRSRYPITLTDERSISLNIGVRRGYCALQISNFQTLRPSEKAKKFQQIANELDVSRWVYQADELHEEWKRQLEEALGMPLSNFAFHFKRWAFRWGQVSDKDWAGTMKSPFTKQLLDLSEQMFQDWYLLRDNIVDYNSIQYLQNSEIDFESWLMDLKIPRISEQYQMNNLSFYVLLSKLQEDFRIYRKQVIETFDIEVEMKMKYSPYFDTKDCIESKRCKSLLESLYRNRIDHQNILLDIDYLEELNTLSERKGFKREYDELSSERVQVVKEYDRFIMLRKRVITLCKEITSEELFYKTNEFDPGWASLESQGNKWTAMSQALDLIHHALLMTPRNIVKQLLNSDVDSPAVKKIQLLWGQIYGDLKQALQGVELYSDIKYYIANWEITDFYQANAQCLEHVKRNNNLKELLDSINKDYGISNTTSLEELVECIRNDGKMRPAIKRQLLNLLEKGYSNLPPSQWRKLIEEFSGQFPTLFESVRLQLVVKGKS